MPQPNELENLLLDSLKRLSEEFELRKKRMTALSNECAASFEEQSNALREQYAEVSKRLDSLTMWLAKVTTQLDALHPSWPKR